MKRTMKITKKTKSKQAQMERALTTLKKVKIIKKYNKINE